MVDVDKIIKIIKTSSEITGSIAGGAIGLIGGPGGVILGGVSGVMITKGLIELTDRYLTNREKLRVAAAVTYSINSIGHRLESGEQVRTDNFFSESDGRSHAAELIEGILLKCRNQHQEKKIKYISNIYTKATFDNYLTMEIANQILYLAESMTYRKFCILAFLFQINMHENVALRNDDYYVEGEMKRLSKQMPLELQLVLQDILELFSSGLLKSNDDTTLLEYTMINPSELGLTSFGIMFCEALGLEELHINEFYNIIDLLETRGDMKQ
ncbi:MAG: hypothetical protein HQ528_02965 [Candidatus Marinimicrobia bacterium]|nr:hypothetical protein [Candidatus Neomarinimicrobiota bacterium]